MPDPRWEQVDELLEQHLLPPDEALDAAAAASAAAGLPPIAVAPLQGKLLHLLTRAQGARRVLEIGTLGGYSTLWLARAVPPDGEVVTLERDAGHAEVARRNLERAGVADRVRLVVGDARQTLATLTGPFDVVFLDADKASNAEYVRRVLDLVRPGSLLVVDNVVRRGAVLDASGDDPDVAGTRALLELLRAEPRLDATALQTVGRKGWDGFVLALVTG